MASGQPPESYHERPLPIGRKFAFGIGHVLNDLCAAMWFSYLLVYYHQVIAFSNIMAGYILLLGQVADGISTPLIGIESDRTNGMFGYGKRKTWHLIGTLCVICSFPFLFNPCITCENAPDWAQFIYYAPFVVIFQFGWAATQISHLSLIPELTSCEHDRVGLNSIRYAFTVISSITVFGITWLLLNTGSAKNEKGLSEKDIPEFRTLVLVVVGIGIIFSLIFHLGTKEKSASELEAMQARLIKSGKRRMAVTCWLKEPQFYLVGVMYMCTRLVVNLTQVYMPMYLTETLELQKTYIAIVPLIVFVSGILATLVMKPLNKKIGRKFTYFLGLCLCAASLIWMYFIQPARPLFVIGAAIFLGFGTSTILVTSLAIVADLIGQNVESGAFVYGAMSFTDKLSNGLAVNMIQQLHPCKTEACCPACSFFYREVMVFVPGGVIVVALIGLAILLPQKIGQRKARIEESMKSCANLSVEQGSCFEESDKEPLLNGVTGSDQNKYYGTTSPDSADQSNNIRNRLSNESQKVSVQDVAVVTTEQRQAAVKATPPRITDSQCEDIKKSADFFVGSTPNSSDC